MPLPGQPLPPDVVAALQKGHALEAVKRLRKATGLGFQEAKDVIDAHRAPRPAAPAPSARPAAPPQEASVAEALRSGNKLLAIQRLREQTGLGLKDAMDSIDGFAADPHRAPGEVPRRSGWLGGTIIALVVALAAYILLRRHGG